MYTDTDTIVAPATAAGGALSVIRLSGPAAVAVADRIFCGRRPLAERAGATVSYGTIRDGGRVVDEVVATLFRGPRSYTGEDTVEFSCHGSAYVVAEVLRLATAAGARMAEPGEFTRRAYLNGRLDLSQAEAVADLIASSSRAAHALATNQLRGGYSSALDGLRERLVHLAALLELELDFGEEEVDFADRGELAALLGEIDAETERLCGSFALGNALKEGIAVAIVGAPNVGKSTLLNRLLQEDRAMVSEIAGTTRDVIEERLTIDGVLFRILDTAGIRHTEDRLERMGIERTMRSIERAQIVVRMIDATTLVSGVGESSSEEAPDAAAAGGEEVGGGGAVCGETVCGGVVCDEAVCGGAMPGDAASSEGAGQPCAGAGACAVALPPFEVPLRPDQRLLTVVNKIDTLPEGGASALPADALLLAARSGEGIERLRHALRAAVPTDGLEEGATVVSSARHHAALTTAREALARARSGIAAQLPTDLLSEEIRAVAASLATITGRGAILPDELLGHIFSKFCIGK